MNNLNKKMDNLKNNGNGNYISTAKPNFGTPLYVLDSLKHHPNAIMSPSPQIINEIKLQNQNL